MDGGRIMNAIWNGVVPAEVLEGIPPPIIRSVSHCTIEEVRAILRIAGGGDVVAVTHRYHHSRTERMFQEEAVREQSVRTDLPESVALWGCMIRERLTPFLIDVVEAAAPSPEEVQEEEKMEKWIYGPLHTTSRLVEIVTFGGCNLEMWMAKNMRG